jgi:hypothetical protein
MNILASLRTRLLALRNRLPLPLQRVANRIAFHSILTTQERHVWKRRLANVLACKDNAFVPRHPDAGRVRGGVMTMHNGIPVYAGSYYGYGEQQILEKNRGCHEPQEERVFAQVLELMPRGATMLELGAYWAFYSLWFATVVPDARNWLVEPERPNLEKGQANFKLNGKRGHFVNARVGAEHRPLDAMPCISVDGLLRDCLIEHLNLLHSDIQGFELDMLRGATQTFELRRVDHVFISTHSNEVHRECVRWLQGHEYIVHQNIDLDASFSFDGLVVASSPTIPPVVALHLDRRGKSDERSI